MNINFYKDDVRMANMRRKVNSTISHQQIQIKIAMRSYFTFAGIIEMKIKISSMGEDVEKSERSYTVDANAK